MHPFITSHQIFFSLKNNISAGKIPEIFEDLRLQMRLNNLNRNVHQMQDESLGIYNCPRCGNTYSRYHSLRRHMRFECGVEPKFECPICHKKTKHKHNLLLHMRTHRSDLEDELSNIQN